MTDQDITSHANGDGEQAPPRIEHEVIENLSKGFLPLACNHARGSGLPEELITPYTACAFELFVNDVFDGTDPDVAYDHAVAGAAFMMGAEMYVTLLKEGGTPGQAFVCLLFFQHQLERSRGEQEVKYLDAWIDAAVAAVTQSAEEGADPVEQIEAGYNALSEAALAT